MEKKEKREKPDGGSVVEVVWDTEVDSELLTFTLVIDFSKHGAAIDAEYDVEKIDSEGDPLTWDMGGWLHFTNNVVVDYTVNGCNHEACLDIVSRKIEELGLGGFWYKSEDNASK
jgi:hypothetical protein